MLGRGWARFIGPLREFGVGAGLLYGASRVLPLLSPRLTLHFYEMLAQPIDAVPDLPDRWLGSFSFAEIVAGSPEVDAMPARAEVKAQRFEHGARCLGAYRRGQLAGYVWWSSGDYQEDEVRCSYRLPAGSPSVFDFDLYVLPEHRLTAGFLAVWHGFAERLRRDGVRYTYSRMTRFNLSSRRAHLRLGSSCVGRLLVLQIGSLELMASTLAPYLAVSTDAASRLPVRLRPPAARHSQPPPWR